MMASDEWDAPAYWNDAMPVETKSRSRVAALVYGGIVMIEIAQFSPARDPRYLLARFHWPGPVIGTISIVNLKCRSVRGAKREALREYRKRIEQMASEAQRTLGLLQGVGT